MRRLLVAGALLVGAVVVAPEPSRDSGDPLASFARSLGGARIAAIDAVFLQAEAARRAGRADDAADLYELALRLDPDDDAAAAYVAEARFDALSSIPEVPIRRDAFLALLDDLEATVSRRARRARLREVAARLVLAARAFDPDLYAALRTRWSRPTLTALRWLADAARETGHLSGTALDRSHLRQAASLAIELAATGIAEQNAPLRDEALEVARDLLSRRGDLLATLLNMPWDTGEDPEPGEAVPLDDLLREGIAAVLAVDRAAPDAAERVAAHRMRAGPTRAARALEDALSTRTPR